ncbi:MAG: GIN domain-containing protein [Anaerolineales bacterium]
MHTRRSFFFPLALISFGLIMLLVNLGTIPSANLWALTQVWPFVLIGLGLGLIMRNYWEWAGLLISLLVVVGVALAILFAPQLGWDSPDFGRWGWGRHSFGGAVRGSGMLEQETRTVGTFDSVSIEFPAAVTIVQGETISLQIEAEDNLLPQLITEVRGDTLRIYNSERNWRSRVNPTETVSIQITTPDLGAVSFEAAGSLTLENTNADELRISLNGAGQIHLIDVEIGNLSLSLDGAGDVLASGIVESLRLDIDGLASFHGNELTTDQADVEINGAGSAELHVFSHLSVEINGTGSVTYFGDPKVVQQINGLGSVTKK